MALHFYIEVRLLQGGPSVYAYKSTTGSPVQSSRYEGQHVMTYELAILLIIGCPLKRSAQYSVSLIRGEEAA